MKKMMLSIPKRFGIAFIALFLALAVAFGVSATANAATISNSGYSCNYTVDSAQHLWAKASSCAAHSYIRIGEIVYGNVEFGAWVTTNGTSYQPVQHPIAAWGVQLASMTPSGGSNVYVVTARTNSSI
jgi:hypothetical protein